VPLRIFQKFPIYFSRQPAARLASLSLNRARRQGIGGDSKLNHALHDGKMSAP
jgi:hypothetical protein